MAEQIGPWTTIGDPLGKGGNSTVHRARRTDGSGPEVALKVLRRWRSPDRLRRFRDEIASLRSLRHEPGVLPLIDAHDPPVPSKRDRPWLAMPIAESLD